MSHKTKSSPEEKVLLIQKYLAGEISAATDYFRVIASSVRNRASTILEKASVVSYKSIHR